MTALVIRPYRDVRLESFKRKKEKKDGRRNMRKKDVCKVDRQSVTVTTRNNPKKK